MGCFAQRAAHCYINSIYSGAGYEKIQKRFEQKHAILFNIHYQILKVQASQGSQTIVKCVIDPVYLFYCL